MSEVSFKKIMKTIAYIGLEIDSSWQRIDSKDFLNQLGLDSTKICNLAKEIKFLNKSDSTRTWEACDLIRSWKNVIRTDYYIKDLTYC